MDIKKLIWKDEPRWVEHQGNNNSNNENNINTVKRKNLLLIKLNPIEMK